MTNQVKQSTCTTASSVKLLLAEDLAHMAAQTADSTNLATEFYQGQLSFDDTHYTASLPYITYGKQHMHGNYHQRLWFLSLDYLANYCQEFLQNIAVEQDFSNWSNKRWQQVLQPAFNASQVRSIITQIHAYLADGRLDDLLECFPPSTMSWQRLAYLIATALLQDDTWLISVITRWERLTINHVIRYQTATGHVFIVGVQNIE